MCFLPADRGPVDVDRTRIGLELTCHAIEQDMLEYQHRIGIFKCGPQHSTHVFEGCRRQYLDPGYMGEPAFQAVRVLGRDLSPCASRILITTGTPNWSPDMCRIVAALLTI